MTTIDGFVAWWFQPFSDSRIRSIRGLLALACGFYFIEAMTDVSVWFGDGGWLRTDHVASFLRLADLESDSRGSISLLYLTDQLWVYCLHLIVGGILSLLWVLPFAQKYQSWVGWLLWLCVAMWANRLLWLAGWPDKLLSMSLSMVVLAGTKPRSSLEAFAIRLLACQTTCVLVMTTATMIAWDVWWDGTGSVALAANTSNRIIDLTDWLTISPWFYELLTHALVLAPVSGVILLWSPRDSKGLHRLGAGLLFGWCTVVALLGNHWLLGVVIASGILALQAVTAKPAVPVPAN